MKRRILDCGAGGPDPKLALFYKNGFESYGINISNDQIKEVNTSLHQLLKY